MRAIRVTPFHVSVTLARLCKGHGTEGTREWSLARVKTQVRLEVGVLREPLGAEVATKWPLACVDALMRSQMCQLFSDVTAEVAAVVACPLLWPSTSGTS